MEGMVSNDGALHRTRRAVAILFFTNGCLFGTWVSRIPSVQSGLGLGTGLLGTALLAIAAGSLVGMPLTGKASVRYGSHQVSRWLAASYGLVTPLLALAPNLGLLTALLFIFGMGNGALDVAMNAQAVEVERLYRRPIMSSFHAMFSMGGLTGSALGGLAADRHLPPLFHFGAMALLLLFVCLGFAFAHLLDDRAVMPGSSGSSTPAGRRFILPLPLLAVGVIAFCSMLGEGAMADWSAIFLRNVRGTSEGFAASGYAAFSIAMAFMRFFGDGLALRWGEARLMQVSGALVVAGFILALFHDSALIALIGFAAVGVGFASVVPLAFSAAGRMPGIASSVALASVTTVGYLGFLFGPPLIGFVAEGVGLRNALALIIGTSSFIIVLAPVVTDKRQNRGSPEGIAVRSER